MERTKIEHSLRLAVTGHRHWKNNEIVKQRLFDSLDTFCYTLKIVYGIPRRKLVFLHGCALGIDMWFGEYARLTDIGFELYLPFERKVQQKKGKFSRDQKAELQKQMSLARKTVVVNDKYSTYGYQLRNMRLVNEADMLLSYYTRSRSGSGNCDRYAQFVKKKVFDLRKFRNIFDLTDVKQVHNLFEKY